MKILYKKNTVSRFEISIVYFEKKIIIIQILFSLILALTFMTGNKKILH